MSAAPEKPASAGALVTAFATIYLLWGSTYLGIHIAVESIPPFTMAGGRFVIAGLILYAIVRLRGEQSPSAISWRDHTIAGTCLLVGGNGMVSWAEQYVPSGIAALIVGASPLFMVLTEWMWPGGHRPGKTTFVGLLLGFAGVVWLAAPWETATAGGLPIGGFVALIFACASWSFGSIFSRHAKHPSSPFMASAQQMIGGGAALFATALVTGELHALDVSAITLRSWYAFIALTIFGSIVGFSTFVWLMKHSTPARVSTYAYVNPVVAVFLGWWILDEPISGRTLVAAAVIVVAVAIITAQKSAKAGV